MAFVKKSCKCRDCTIKISAGVALELSKGFAVTHVLSINRVAGEHGRMSSGLRTFDRKLIR